MPKVKENMEKLNKEDDSAKTYEDGFADGKKVENQRIIDMLLLTEAAFAEKTGEPGAWELSAIVPLLQVEESPF